MDLKGSTFTCSGKVNSNDFLLDRTGILIRDELERVTDHTIVHHLDQENVQLFGYNYPAASAILNLKHLIYSLEMHLKILNRYVMNNNNNNILAQKGTNLDFFKSRKSVCDLILYTRTYLLSVITEWPTMPIEQNTMIIAVNTDIEDLLIRVSRFLGQLKDIPSSTYHYVTANVGNKCNQPEFHLYHTHIELRWLLVTLLYSRSVIWEETDQLDKTIELIIDDLICISTKIFERINLSDLGQKNPYSCTCIRDMWLMLQLFVQIVNDKYGGKTFWDYVNISLDGIIGSNNEGKKKLTWQNENEGNYPDIKNPEVFSIWMIYHLTLLYGYSYDGIYIGPDCSRNKSLNHDEIEKVLKSFLIKGGKEGDRDETDEELRIMIPMLKTLNDWIWPQPAIAPPKVTIITLIWDCFHRRLDEPFLIQTSGPWSVSLEKKTPFDILKQVRARIETNFDSSKESSYGLFLRFLGMMLKVEGNKEVKDMKVWTQLQGRIFVKFQKQKLEESTETKIFNFISLFLTLAVTANTPGVCSKLQDLLPSVLDLASQDNPRRTSLVFKSLMACLALLAEKQQDLQPIAEQIVQIVDVISCKKDDLSRSMMVTFVETLEFVLSSNATLDHGENYLIGGWIDRYLIECPRTRVNGILKMLITIFPRANDKMLDCLWSVAPRIRTMVFDADISGDNYRTMAELAAQFTLCAMKNPLMASNHRHTSKSLFEHFTSIVKVKDIRVTIFYLSIILERVDAVNSLKNIVKNYDLILIQAWIKACILNYDSERGEILILKKHVIDLEKIKELFPSWKDARDFKADGQSFFRFILAVKTRRQTMHESMCYAFDVKIRLFFKDLEKWILIPITEDNINSELASCIYNCLGSILTCCGVMLHTKNSPSSPLKNLIKTCLLFADDQAYLKKQSKRLFAKAISGLGGAGAKTDVTLHAIIVDLINAYLPLIVIPIDKTKFRITEPVIRMFTDGTREFGNFLIDKITAAFISPFHGNKTHDRCHLVMAVFENFLNTLTSPEWLIEAIVIKALPKVIEIYFKVHELHPHKKQVNNFMIALSKNSYYEVNEKLKDNVRKTIATISNNYLEYKPHVSFELLKSLLRVNHLPVVQYTVDIIEAKTQKSQSLKSLLDELRKDMKTITS